MAENRKFFTWLTTDTLLHFLVDFSCIYLMSSTVHSIVGVGEKWIYLVMLYNFLAFAGQMFVGALSDLFRNKMHFTQVGIGFLLVAYGVSFINHDLVWFITSCLGIGNACFHIGGGSEVLCHSPKPCRDAGIFVCSGAMGVFLGRKLISTAFPLRQTLCSFLILGFIYLTILDWKKYTLQLQQATFSLQTNGNALWKVLASVLCFVVVILRSFAGHLFSFGWSAGIFVFLTTVAVILGKAMGGVLSEIIGMKKTIVISLVLSSILFLFAEQSAICGLLAVFLFNMTMPITLSLIAEAFPKAIGFGFGVLTLGIFIGTLPFYFILKSDIQFPTLNTILTIISLALLIPPMLWIPKKEKNL